MTDAEFHDQVAKLREIPYREEFQTSLCNLYLDCEPSYRDQLRRGINNGDIKCPAAWRFPTAYGRSDQSREQRIHESFLMMSINGLSDDIRDDLATLGYYYNNLPLLGIHADSHFEKVAKLSDPAFAEFIRAFVKRRPWDKGLRAWGLKIVHTPDGPEAVRSETLPPGRMSNLLRFFRRH